MLNISPRCSKCLFFFLEPPEHIRRNYSCLDLHLYLSLVLLPLHYSPIFWLMLIEIQALSFWKNHFMSTCQYCTVRNKSKMTRLSNHMLQEAVQCGYAGSTRISKVLTRILCSVSYVSKLILQKKKKKMGSFHSFIPNCHCHGYNILSLRDAEG